MWFPMLQGCRQMTKGRVHSGVTCVESPSGRRRAFLKSCLRTRSRLISIALAGGISLAVYVWTLAPTVTAEDSGELVAAAHFFGVAHPPGYPLWTMLCGVFMRIVPFGNIAWRANLFSAVCAAGAIAALCAMLCSLRFRSPVALAAALACAFGSALWSQSVIAEVYALHVLLTVLAIWAVIQWDICGRDRYLLYTALVLGLGMSNHHTIGFVGLALVVWVLIRQPRLLRRVRLIAASAALFAAGLLPYAYLPIRARAQTPMNWGSPTTATKVWNHVSRRQYKSSVPKPPSPESVITRRWAQMRYLVRYCLRQYTPWLAPLMAGGLVLMWSRKRLTVLVLLLLVCAGPAFAWLSDFGSNRQDLWCLRVFLLPLPIALTVPLAVAVEFVTRRIARWNVPLLSWRPVGAAVSLSIAAAPLLAHYTECNYRNYWYAHDHANNMLASMLQNAVIFPSGDHNTFPLIYLVLVEGHRSDVTIADKYGYIEPSLYEDMPDNPGLPRTPAQRKAIEKWIIRNMRRPVYYAVKKDPGISEAQAVPVGMLYHLLPEGYELDHRAPWEAINYRNRRIKAPRDHGADNILADYQYFQAITALRADTPDTALEHFAKCAEHGWGIKEICNNIGSALAEHGLTAEALDYYRRATQIDPRYKAAWWNMARVAKSLQQWDLAEQCFRKLTEIDDQDFRPWGELGFIAKMHAGDTEEAIRCWEQSIKLNPRQPQILTELLAYYEVPPVTSQTYSGQQLDHGRECEPQAVTSCLREVESPSATATAPAASNGKSDDRPASPATRGAGGEKS